MDCTPLAEGLSIRCDFLHLTLSGEHLDEILSHLKVRLGTPEAGSGLNFYERSWRWECGAILCYSDARSDCWLKLPGNCISQAGDLHDLLDSILARGGRCTRFDIALDTHAGHWSMDEIHAAAARDAFCGPRLYDSRRPRKSGELQGDTAYFGSRASGRLVRFYDKQLETRTQLPWLRFEVELHADAAAAAFDAWRMTPRDDRDRFAASIVAASIDFREPSGPNDRHLARRDRLPWWKALVDLLGQAKPRIERAVAPLQVTMEWFSASCCRFLAKFIQVMTEQGMDGDKIVSDLIHNADAKARDWRPGAKDMSIDLSALLETAL